MSLIQICIFIRKRQLKQLTFFSRLPTSRLISDVEWQRTYGIFRHAVEEESLPVSRWQEPIGWCEWHDHETCDEDAADKCNDFQWSRNGDCFDCCCWCHGCRWRLSIAGRVSFFVSNARRKELKVEWVTVLIVYGQWPFCKTHNSQ